MRPLLIAVVTASVRLPAFSLPINDPTWNFTVRSDIPSLSAIVRRELR